MSLKILMDKLLSLKKAMVRRIEILSLVSLDQFSVTWTLKNLFSEVAV